MSDLGDLTRWSVVELEHALRRALTIPDPDDVAALRLELAGRTWQNVNPWARWLPVR